jgi:hypothetical protein
MVLTSDDGLPGAALPYRGVAVGAVTASSQFTIGKTLGCPYHREHQQRSLPVRSRGGGGSLSARGSHCAHRPQLSRRRPDLGERDPPPKPDWPPCGPR